MSEEQKVDRDEGGFQPLTRDQYSDAMRVLDEESKHGLQWARHDRANAALYMAREGEAALREHIRSVVRGATEGGPE